jgi:geranylgeranyl reductase family protein
MTIRVRAASPADADIAIVGAGPAGAAAACHLAGIGFHVVLIDQRCFPRDKVCGDFVGPAALAELDRLGLFSQPTLHNANKIRNGALYVNGDRVVARPFPYVEGLRDYGLCIPRMLLDDAIVRAAVASGARLIEEARVTGYETDGAGVTLFHQGSGGQKRLRARLLVGADGSSSLISRILRGRKPPRRDQIVAVRAYFEGVEGATDQADLYVNSSSLPGYYWLFPTGTSSANVGVGMLLEAWMPTRQQLSQLLIQLIESDPAIRLRLARAKMNGKIVGWPLATFNPELPIIANRVALIGDAAGLINPLSGEGIQYALRSARWIVEALRDAMGSDTLSAAGLRPYATRVQAEMQYDMALSRLIIDFLRNRALNPIWLWMLGVIAKRAASDSGCYDIAAGVFAGVLPARELLTLRFLWRTVKCDAATEYAAAIDVLRGRRRLLSGRPTLTNAVASMFKDSVRHPIGTLHWGADCGLSALELAAHMAMATVKIPEDADGIFQTRHQDTSVRIKAASFSTSAPAPMFSFKRSECPCESIPVDSAQNPHRTPGTE